MPTKERPAQNTLSRAATILVVEDEQPVRRVVVRMLEQSGFTVKSASSGADALAQLANDKVDLIVADVIMPGMSGGQMAMHVRERYPELPIIFMSGYNDDSIVKAVVKKDAARLIAKPFTREELLTLVDAELS